MELAAVNSSATAFVAGLVTSLHCVGMCGPLSCSLLPRPGESADLRQVTTVYHVSRLLSYAALGGIAGAIGRMPLLWVSTSALRWLP
ncbi:MAG TPA: sulfite exporter TauE/SafE family protein, partial [Opitutaceae bacterium]|nr:sulfite exporter TauE/SafE family protein [Opitutaceae bacterium]